MLNVSKFFYCLPVFMLLLTGCKKDPQTEQPVNDSLKLREQKDVIRIDEPMQAYLLVK
jgi:hypothetical protein